MTGSRIGIVLVGLFALSASAASPQPATAYDFSKLRREKLGRGIVAFRSGEREAVVTWRYRMQDPTNLAFNVYRDGQLLNAHPLAGATFYKDTTFDPKDRIQTMRNIKEAGLNLMTCTEPVGAEHSIDEVIGNYFGGMQGGCDCGYLALRMPVFGTPLGGMPTLSIKRYHQMQSVLGLASSWHDGGKRVTGWDTGYFTGLNTLSAEFAGSPRDSAPLSEKSVGHTLEWCRRTLFGDGFDKIRMADGSVQALDVDYLKRTASI